MHISSATLTSRMRRRSSSTAILADHGFVMNNSLVWAHEPSLKTELFDVLRSTVIAGDLSMRQRGILVVACASARRDSYCSLAWGGRLADASSAEIAAQVIGGDDSGLTESEQMLARWARMVARDANGTTAKDVQLFRDGGFSDRQIFGVHRVRRPAAGIFDGERRARRAAGRRPDRAHPCTGP